MSWCGDSTKQRPNDDSATCLPRMTHRSISDDADDGRFLDLALAPLEHVEAHEDRERDRHADREHAPRALGQRVDDDEAEAGERDDEDEEDRDGGGDAGDRTDLGARDLGQRPAAAPGRRPQRDHVVDGAGEARQPASSQMKPGAQPNCAASTGPISGPAPVMAAK